MTYRTKPKQIKLENKFVYTCILYRLGKPVCTIKTQIFINNIVKPEMTVFGILQYVYLQLT